MPKDLDHSGQPPAGRGVMRSDFVHEKTPQGHSEGTKWPGIKDVKEERRLEGAK